LFILHLNKFARQVWSRLLGVQGGLDEHAVANRNRCDALKLPGTAAASIAKKNGFCFQRPCTPFLRCFNTQVKFILWCNGGCHAEH